MRTIHTNEIKKQVYSLCLQANYDLDAEIMLAFQKNQDNEVVQDLIENAQIAHKDRVPICQDTGLILVFLEIGQQVTIKGDDLTQTINSAIADAYTENYLRKSVLNNPLERVNTNTNTPAIIYSEIVPGEQLKITIVPKGGGSENKSALKMLVPSDGEPGISDFVLDTVKKAGASACPPFIIGVGLGGSFDYVGLLAKKALLRKLGQQNPNPAIAKLETNLLNKINELKIGPAGFGGQPTALAVHIECYACHIASLPVAVNIGCHANRHAEAII